MKQAQKNCAIYTRKSTDERLDMEFNTLDAQREACEAYIVSQRSEGWLASPEQYDDGGFSGGSLERPALNRLINDIKAGKVDVIVVYKIDRLTRSLADFAKLVDVFDEYGVTFVSVTQSFNTTTSMGRLTLNVLLSFAQFEREVTSERIRDKIAASKAKGMWQGGRAPFGFDIENRRLITNVDDAPIAKQIFELYLELGSVRALEAELKSRGIKSRERISEKGRTYGGQYFGRGALYGLLSNPAYIGKISHKGIIHEGLHDGIIPQDIWDTVQAKLQEQAPHPRGQTNTRHSNLLTGKIFDEDGAPYTPVFTKKKGKQYRYYLNKSLDDYKNHPKGLIARLPAHEIEATVEAIIRTHLSHKSKLLKILPLHAEDDDHVMQHIIDHQSSIRAAQLFSKSISKVIVKRSSLVIQIDISALRDVISENLKLGLPEIFSEEVIELTTTYKTRKANSGAVVIEPEKYRDPLDLPQNELENLVKGLVWREEHFSGSPLQMIADKYGHSKSHIHINILKTLKTA